MAVWSVDFLVVIPVLKKNCCLIMIFWYLKVGCFRTVQDLLNLQIQWIFLCLFSFFFVAVDYKNCNQLSFCSGPVLALGLAREDAITGWRHMLGPTEVEKAKSEAPERWIFIKLPIVSFNGNYCPYCSPQIRFTFCLEKLFLQKNYVSKFTCTYFQN